MKYEMPTLSDEQRELCIDEAEKLIKTLRPGSYGYHLSQIALAALTAEPFAILRPFGDQQRTFVVCDDEHPSAKHCYNTPPVPAMKASGRTMPRHEFAQMVNELRDCPAVQSKREKIVRILHAFNINPDKP